MWLAEAQDFFRAFAAEPVAHEPRRRIRHDDFPVRCDVIAVRMADEHMPGLGPVRIQPQTEAGQVDAALLEFNRERRHAVENGAARQHVNGGLAPRSAFIRPPRFATEARHPRLRA
jgi:hypothetical protein